MNVRTLAATLAVVSLAAAVARADVYTSTFDLSGGSYLSRYSDSGQFASGYYARNFSAGWANLAFGPNNTLYVGEGFGITLFDATTLAVKGRISGLDANGQQVFNRPGKIAVDSTGAVYAIDNGQTPPYGGTAERPSALLRFDPANTTSVTRTTEWAYVNFSSDRDAVGVGPDGQVLVRQNGRIVRGSGARAGEVFASGPAGYSRLDAFAFGPGGDVYAVAFDDTAFRPAVLRFNGTSGAFVNVLVPPTTTPLIITDIGFTTAGDLLMVSGDYDGSIYRYNGTTGAYVSLFLGRSGPTYVGLATTGIPEPAAGLTSIAAVAGLLCRRRGG